MIKHYLLVYDRDADKLIETIEFGRNWKKAVDAYDKKEREYWGRPRIEVVLIGSDSLETIKITHANYFGGLPASSKYSDLLPSIP